MLRLADKYSRAQMLRAAKQALDQRLFRYAAFQRLAARPVPPAPRRALIEHDPAIRPIEQYSMADFLMAPPPSLSAAASDVPPLPEPGDPS